MEFLLCPIVHNRSKNQKRATRLPNSPELAMVPLTETIPKEQGSRTDIDQLAFTTESKLSKKEVLKNMGFSELHAHRFETLADNPDLRKNYGQCCPQVAPLRENG
jgi:hypothetical protein